MRWMKNSLSLGVLVPLLAAGPAQAFVIKNLSDRPQTLTIEQLGSRQELTLPPGGRYQRLGVGIVLHQEGRETPIIVRQDGEYSIWPDGDIHIQRYKKVQMDGR